MLASFVTKPGTRASLRFESAEQGNINNNDTFEVRCAFLCRFYSQPKSKVPSFRCRKKTVLQSDREQQLLVVYANFAINHRKRERRIAFMENMCSFPINYASATGRLRAFFVERARATC